MRKFAVFFLLILSLFPACKTPPPQPPGEEPRSTLIFDRIEADSIYKIVLYFTLITENPRSVPLIAAIQDWQTTINDAGMNSEAARLVLAESAETGDTHTPVEIAGGGTAETRLALRLDLSGFAAETSAEADDEYLAGLSLDMSYRYGAAETSGGTASITAVFPRVREPVFTITSIAIMQAELINTRFRVSLRVDNPNPFPVTLSSFAYALYGEGLFWADGREKDVLLIPAKGFSETSLFLLMNFINMKRGLLNEIIAMRLVNYRFTGETQVSVDIPWLPHFSMKFDRSGRSEVFE